MLLLKELLVFDVVFVHFLSLANKGVCRTFISLTFEVQQIVSYDFELFVRLLRMRSWFSHALVETESPFEIVFARFHHHRVRLVLVVLGGLRGLALDNRLFEPAAEIALVLIIEARFTRIHQCLILTESHST